MRLWVENTVCLKENGGGVQREYRNGNREQENAENHRNLEGKTEEGNSLLDVVATDFDANTGVSSRVSHCQERNGRRKVKLVQSTVYQNMQRILPQTPVMFVFFLEPLEKFNPFSDVGHCVGIVL